MGCKKSTEPAPTGICSLNYGSKDTDCYKELTEDQCREYALNHEEKSFTINTISKGLVQADLEIKHASVH